MQIIMTLLPSRIRDEIVRRSISLPGELPQGLVFKIAQTTQELEAAFKLVYESYHPLGYCSENEHKMRATFYHALPTTTTLIAVDQERIVGTLTVVRDNRLGLPLDKIFDVKSLRGNAHRLAEITSLVIHRDYRREKGGQILFPLLRLMYEYSTSYFGVNHLLVTIHPKDVHFYKSLLLFKVVPKTDVKDYLGAPAVVLHLDLKQALLEYEKIYANRNQATNLFDFFVMRKISNVKLPKREYNKINDPLVSLDYFQKVFLGKLQLSSNDLVRRRVESILSLKFDSRRVHPRIEVEAPASVTLRIQDEITQAKIMIKDVSRHGFRAFVEENFLIQSEFNIQIEVAPKVTAYVKVQAVWMSPDLGVGFHIIKADENWHEFINFLYRDQYGRAV